MYACMHVYLSLCIYICICMYSYIFIRVSMCVYIYICMYLYMQVRKIIQNMQRGPSVFDGLQSFG